MDRGVRYLTEFDGRRGVDHNPHVGRRGDQMKWFLGRLNGKRWFGIGNQNDWPNLVSDINE